MELTLRTILVMQILFLSKSIVRSKVFTSLNRMMMSSHSKTDGSFAIASPLISGIDALSLSSLPNVRFVDGSWHMNKSRIGYEEFLTSRIPNAQFFNIDLIADKSSNLPHMLPSNEDFERHISALGISSTDHIIVYVKEGSFSGPRVWWTFRAFGHEKVSLIDGGLNSWVKAGGPLETTNEVKSTPHGEFKATPIPISVDWGNVLQVVEKGSCQILDARSNGRFLGTAPEPRAGKIIEPMRLA